MDSGTCADRGRYNCKNKSVRIDVGYEQGQRVSPSEGTDLKATRFNTFDRVDHNRHVLVAEELASPILLDVHLGQEDAEFGVAMIHSYFGGSDAHIQVVLQNSFYMP